MPHRLIAVFAAVAALALVVGASLYAQTMEELPPPPEVELAPADGDDGEEAAEEGAEEEGPRHAELNQEAPDFTLTDQHGNERSLSDYRGKIIAIEWINWRCPYCVVHFRIGTQRSLLEQFADSDPGFVYIGVNSSRWSTPEHNLEQQNQWEGLDFPVFCDASGEVGRIYQARTTPHMYVIDADFKLRYIGAMDNDSNARRNEAAETNYVEQAVRALLAGEEVETSETRPYGCRVQYARDGRRR